MSSGNRRGEGEGHEGAPDPLRRQELQQVGQELKAFVTKEDLQSVKQDLQQVRQEQKAFVTKEDLQPVTQDLLWIRQEVENRYVLLARELESLRSDVARDLEALRLSMTVRLGSMLFVGLGLLFAALKLT